jgi:hypothetical protein
MPKLETQEMGGMWREKDPAWAGRRAAFHMPPQGL